MNDENPYKSPETRADGGINPSSGAPPETGREPMESRLLFLTSFLNHAEAQFCQAILRQEGIESFIENDGFGLRIINAVGGFKVMVPHEKLQDAIELIGGVETEQKKREPLGDITFDCEECGKEITFPGKSRGKVETCPKCHEYVDVPD